MATGDQSVYKMYGGVLSNFYNTGANTKGVEKDLYSLWFTESFLVSWYKGLAITLNPSTNSAQRIRSWLCLKRDTRITHS